MWQLRRWGGSLLIFVSGLMPAWPAAAHDFWMRVRDYRVETSDAPVRIFFEINEVDKPEPWELYRFKVVALRSHGPQGIADHQSELTEHQGNVPGFADARLGGPGTHLVAFESNHSVSDLPAKSFNLYAEEEGLRAITAARTATRTTQRRGRELYSRRAKAIVQVGELLSPDVTRPLGQTLEIVPLSNPHALAPDAPLRVRLLFQGRPLVGARIHLSQLAPTPRRHFIMTTTDAAGEAAFAFPRSGDWSLVSVWGYPLPDTRRADFETIFSSLTFGF